MQNILLLACAECGVAVLVKCTSAKIVGYSVIREQPTVVIKEGGEKGGGW